MRIVFPFFYGLHQLYHTAVTSIILSTYLKNAEVICLTSTKDQTKALIKVKNVYPKSKTEIIQLPPPFRFKYLNIKKKKYPYVRTMVRRGKKILNYADIIVTTSHGTYNMFHDYNISKPYYIYQYHGIGDRSYGFDKRLAKYDLILLGGEYHYKRLLEEGIGTKEKLKIVGYPKFDYPITDFDRTKFFNNDKPIVLYAPHWSPKLTSYKKFAIPVLEYFQKNRNFNLIFSPHILVAHWKVRMGYKTNLDKYKNENIVIDFGTNYATNGTYLQISDIYMGDVSSMVYEFIARKPRPCVFINAHNADWENSPDYRFWQYGPVIESINDLDIALKEAQEKELYLEKQRRNIKKYINLTNEKSSVRAAKAIMEFIKNKKIDK